MPYDRPRRPVMVQPTAHQMLLTSEGAPNIMCDQVSVQTTKYTLNKGCSELYLLKGATITVQIWTQNKWSTHSQTENCVQCHLAGCQKNKSIFPSFTYTSVLLSLRIMEWVPREGKHSSGQQPRGQMRLGSLQR